MAVPLLLLQLSVPGGLWRRLLFARPGVATKLDSISNGAVANAAAVAVAELLHQRLPGHLLATESLDLSHDIIEAITKSLSSFESSSLLQDTAAATNSKGPLVQLLLRRRSLQAADDGASVDAGDDRGDVPEASAEAEGVDGGSATNDTAAEGAGSDALQEGEPVPMCPCHRRHKKVIVIVSCMEAP